MSIDPQQFYKAIERDQRETVKELLDREPNLIAERYKQRSPLATAAMLGNKDIVELICTYSTDPSDLNAALYTAAANDQTPIIDLLLKQGAIVDIKSAARMGNIDILQALLEHAPDLLNDAKGSWPPLHHAASGWKLEATQFLIQQGADVNRRLNQSHWTAPLHIACASSPKAPTDQGRKVVERLHREGTDLQAKGSGASAIYQAAHCGTEGHIFIVEYLLEQGIDINEKYRGETALNMAIKFGHLEMVRFLLANGSDPRKTGKKGKSPFQAARSKQMKSLLSEYEIKEE